VWVLVFWVGVGLGVGFGVGVGVRVRTALRGAVLLTHAAQPCASQRIVHFILELAREGAG
jgi:hypothetical protein